MIDLNKNEILVLRTCDSKGQSFQGFQWPLEVGAIVEAPDWNPEPVLEGGLHGLPWGEGSANCILKESDVIWMLIAVDNTKDYVEITDGCKFKKGRIAHIGKQKDTIEILQLMATNNPYIIFARQDGEDRTVQIAGDFSIQNAGNYSIQEAKTNSIQVAKDFCFQKTNGYSNQTAGKYSTQIIGNNSVQRADIGTVQVIKWIENNEWKENIRVIDKSTANKLYSINNGKWHEIMYFGDDNNVWFAK